MFHCIICGAWCGSRGLWSMSLLCHMLLGYRFYVGTWWDIILFGFHILCKRWQHKIALTWCDWKAACMITTDLHSKVGYFRMDMVCLVIFFSLCYWCRGVIFFGDAGLVFGECSLVLLVHVDHFYFFCDFYLTVYSCWGEAWPSSEVAIIYGFEPCGDDRLSHSDMIIFN